MKHVITIILTAVFFLPVSSYSQVNPDVSHIGLGAGVVMPTGDFSDYYEMGYEFHAKNVSHFSENLAIGAHLGIQTFSGKTITLSSGAEESFDGELQFVLSAGPEYRQDNWFLGVHVGYVAGDEEASELIAIPTAGIMIGGLQLTARYKLLGDYSWFGAGVTYYFLEW